MSSEDFFKLLDNKIKIGKAKISYRLLGKESGKRIHLYTF